jgi:hypothetical protein
MREKYRLVNKMYDTLYKKTLLIHVIPFAIFLHAIISSMHGIIHGDNAF